MQHIYDDGGRAAAGFKGNAGDCVARAVAIASGRPYAEVYAALASGNECERRSKHGRSARNGIHVTRRWFRDYMHSLGFEWVPTMGIGTGCRVHLADGELPMGRLVVSVSKHYTAVIDGTIRDTYNPQRDPVVTHWYDDGSRAGITRTTVSGGRCVYGYWRFAHAARSSSASAKPAA